MAKFCTQTHTDHVQNVLSFMSKVVVITKKWHFSRTVCMQAYSFAAVTGRSAGWLGGCSHGLCY